MLRQEPLTIQNLGMGKFIAQANEGLARICEDVMTRPRNDKPRKLVIEIEVTPDNDDELEMNLPDMTYSIRWALPGVKGVAGKGIVQDGQILVNIDDPDPRQYVLDNVESFNDRKIQEG